MTGEIPTPFVRPEKLFSDLDGRDLTASGCRWRIERVESMFGSAAAGAGCVPRLARHLHEQISVKIFRRLQWTTC
jgi:hypothetical protein